MTMKEHEDKDKVVVPVEQQRCVFAVPIAVAEATPYCYCQDDQQRAADVVLETDAEQIQDVATTNSAVTAVTTVVTGTVYRRVDPSSEESKKECRDVVSTMDQSRTLSTEKKDEHSNVSTLSIMETPLVEIISLLPDDDDVNRQPKNLRQVVPVLEPIHSPNSSVTVQREEGELLIKEKNLKPQRTWLIYFLIVVFNGYSIAVMSYYYDILLQEWPSLVALGLEVGFFNLYFAYLCAMVTVLRVTNENLVIEIHPLKIYQRSLSLVGLQEIHCKKVVRLDPYGKFIGQFEIHGLVQNVINGEEETKVLATYDNSREQEALFVKQEMEKFFNLTPVMVDAEDDVIHI